LECGTQELAPRLITLDDLELDGGRPPLLSNTSLTPAVYNIVMIFGSSVGLSGLAILMFTLWSIHSASLMTQWIYPWIVNNDVMLRILPENSHVLYL